MHPIMNDDIERLSALILLEAKRRRDPNYRDLITEVSRDTGREPDDIEQEILEVAGHA